MTSPDPVVEARFKLIESRLQEGEGRFERIEKGQRSHFEGLQTLNKRLDDGERRQGQRHAELMGSVEGIRRKAEKVRYPTYSDEDADAISDVTDIEEVRKKARQQRDIVKHTRRVARGGIPIAIVIGGVIWELIKAYFSR